MTLHRHFGPKSTHTTSRRPQKYSPDQPRVPAGNSDGGQWTSEGGSGLSSQSSNGSEPTGASRPAQYAALDTGTRTDASAGESGVRVAAGTGQSGSPVDLQEEEKLGGHTIRDHVGKSDAELLQELKGEIYWTVPATFIGRREGSFASIESANDLVNQTLAANSATVDLVASGQLEQKRVTFSSDSVTGREAFRADPDSDPYIRETNAVGVVIVYDPRSPRGFRVLTAFPMNDD